MLLYNDIIFNPEDKSQGDELFSDAFPVKLVDDIVYEVDCTMITINDGEVDIGANPSAEGGEEGAESTAQTVNNVVHTFRLEQTQFDKQGYKAYLKGYMKTISKKLKETNPERVPVFEKKATDFVKKVLSNFKDYEFYIGESMDPDTMVALLNYREDGVTPYFTFFKDGVKEQKL